MTTNTQITPAVKPSALAVMASRFAVDPAKLHSTLKNTVFKGASDEEMLSLVVVANSYNLNPLTKEIYAFPAKGGGIVPVVSVDGWCRIINDHPQTDGIEFEFEHDETGKLISCTAIIYRKDRTRPVKATEYLAECRRNTEPWKMEHRMLRHKALIQCARIAFGFSGIYDEDEAERIKTANATVVATNKPVFAVADPAPTEIELSPAKPRAKKAAKPVFEAQEEPETTETPEEPTEDAPETPQAEPSPQRDLYVALADCGIMEGSFIGWLKKQGIRAETIMGLPDDIAEDCLEKFAAIQEALS